MKIFTKISIFFLFSFVSLLTFTSKTYACSCAMPKSVSERFTEMEAVFSGKVLDVDKPLVIQSSLDNVSVKFEVKDVWKGNIKSETKINTALSSASCGFEFEEGKSYLVYARKSTEGELTTGLCDWNQSEAEMTQDVAELNKVATAKAPEKLTTTGAITGKTKSFFEDNKIILVVVVSIVILGSLFVFYRRSKEKKK